MRDHAYGRLFGLCLLLSAVSLAPCASASAETLVLMDGDVIHGEISALQDGVYVVRTDSLGTIRVNKKDVRTIEQGDVAPSRSPAAPTSGESVPGQVDLQAMQSLMMKNPDMLAMIEALQNDPQVMAVLADPEITAALAAGNYAALMNNPKILALTENAKVRAVVDAAQ